MRRFTCVLDVWYPKREWKREKNARKLANARKTQEDFSISHYALGKNASQLRFFRHFGTFEITKTQTQRIV